MTHKTRSPSNPVRLINRAYGNWLGLAQLQEYVATTTGLVLGELAFAAGHAFVDLSGTKPTRLREILEAAREHA